MHVRVCAFYLFLCSFSVSCRCVRLLCVLVVFRFWLFFCLSSLRFFLCYSCYTCALTLSLRFLFCLRASLFRVCFLILLCFARLHSPIPSRSLEVVLLSARFPCRAPRGSPPLLDLALALAFRPHLALRLLLRCVSGLLVVVLFACVLPLPLPRLRRGDFCICPCAWEPSNFRCLVFLFVCIPVVFFLIELSFYGSRLYDSDLEALSKRIAEVCRYPRCDCADMVSVSVGDFLASRAVGLGDACGLWSL